MSKEDFASLLEESMKGGKGAPRRLRNGDVVEGKVIQIGSDSVFLDIAATQDARIPRAELQDAEGNVRIKLGEVLRATVVDANADNPLLAVSLGRGGIDLGQLRTALETGAAVSGKVTRAVKGGLEVDVGGIRAFCPASQIELGYAEDLQAYEGQTLELRVLEIKDSGRSVVVSRKALLELERRGREEALRETLVPGADLEGTVTSLSRHGAIVDVGGIDGFVHVSELAHRRVDKAEDVVNVGDRVQVRVIGVEQGDRGLRVRLSVKARVAAADVPAPAVDEVLDATVVKTTGGGIIVSTAKGDGLVPLAELGLAPSADHRRAFPVGKVLKVVLAQRDPSRGRLRFSAVGVARVEERQNYRDFGAAGAAGASFGSFGDLLRKQLGLPDAPRAPVATEVPTAPAMAAVDAPKGDPEGVVRRKR